MVDIIGTIATMVGEWDDESKCGLCWEFTAPMRDSDLNECQQRTDDCCVTVAVTEFRFQLIQNVNRQSGLITNTSEIYDFNLHYLAKDNLGLNVYNEIDGHPLAESKWATIIKPLMDCISLPVFCEYIGRNLEVTLWRANLRIDWQDMNWSGWTINVQLRNNNT